MEDAANPERRDAQEKETGPWKVERSAGAAPRPRPQGPRWPWLALGIVAALTLSFVLYREVAGDHERVAVPYSLFRAQADAGNIGKASSKGDTIEDESREDVTVPGEEESITHLFKTERPAFADDSVLEVLLDEGATVDVRPESRRSALGTPLVGFGPALLIMGGRAAEALVFGDVTTGAQSDLAQATMIARQVVAHWGMSDTMGLMALPAGEEGGFLLGSSDAPSEHTRRLIDDEVRRLTAEAYAWAAEHETLDEADAYRAWGMPARSTV